MNSLIRLILLLFCLPALAAPQRPDLARTASLVVSGTNDFRRAESRADVESNRRLEEAAQAFADFMAKTGKYGHEADGSAPAERARRHGYDFCLVSENIAYQYSSAGFATADLAKRLVEGWKNSPGHRKNMLERDALHTAVALAASPRDGRYYAVQLFARPRSASVEFQVRNASSTAARYRVDDRAFTLPPGVVRTHSECTPETLRFDEPAGSFRTTRGARYVVKRERGKLVVQPE